MSMKISLPDETGPGMACSGGNVHRESPLNNHLSTHIKVEPPQSYGEINPLDLKGVDSNDPKKSMKGSYINSVHTIPKTEDGMRRQFEMMSKDLESQHLCYTCGGKFSRKDHLVRHYSIHKGTRYNCSVCNKSFSRKDHVKRHMALHSGKGHPCNICDRVFAEKHRLRKHQLTHATIKL